MSEQTRPIWLTEKQALDHGLAGSWDMAPADAAKCVMHALYEAGYDQNKIQEAVLKALGKP